MTHRPAPGLPRAPPGGSALTEGDLRRMRAMTRQMLRQMKRMYGPRDGE